MKKGAKRLLGALCALREAGITHGRIWPENILLGRHENGKSSLISIKGLYRSCLETEMIGWGRLLGFKLDYKRSE